MRRQEKYKTLKQIFWDVNLSGNEIYAILFEERQPIGNFNRDRVLIRMLERLGWYDIIDILSIDEVKTVLNKEFISKIWRPELREKYEFIRKILSGEPIPATGWGDEYYQKIKHTLFPNRWNRSKQNLL